MVERHFINRHPGFCAIVQSSSKVQTVVCAMQPLPERGMSLEWLGKITDCENFHKYFGLLYVM